MAGNKSHLAIAKLQGNVIERLESARVTLGYIVKFDHTGQSVPDISASGIGEQSIDEFLVIEGA
jgi:hypothetical protein